MMLRCFAAAAALRARCLRLRADAAALRRLDTMPPLLRTYFYFSICLRFASSRHCRRLCFMLLFFAALIFLRRLLRAYFDAFVDAAHYADTR